MSTAAFRRAVNARADRVRTLASLVSPDFVRQWTEVNRPTSSVVLHLPDITSLRARRERCLISLQEWFRDANGSAEMSGCQYVVSAPSTVQEIIAFHRHGGRFGSGHYHLGPAAGPLSPSFDKAHIPAPGVTLELFIEMLITEFGLQPLRADWMRVLAT